MTLLSTNTAISEMLALATTKVKLQNSF